MNGLRAYFEWRHPLPIARALCLAGLVLTGCINEPPPPPAGAELVLGTKEYIDFFTSLGIVEEYFRVSQSVPEYLLDVPGVDGEGPFKTETIALVPFRRTPTETLTVNVHRPIAADGTLRRAVVAYMGGAYVTDAEFDTIEVWCDYLASRGFVAFNPRLRVVTTPGVTWRDVYSDTIAAVRFVAAEGPSFGADPDRIATLGRSSGGHLALIAGMVRDPEVFGEAGDPAVPVKVRAVVDFFGPTDYARFFEEDQFSFLSPGAMIFIFGGTPDEVPQAYEATSAFTYVRPDLPPTLIIHGELDLVVPIAHSLDLADQLAAAGNIVQREIYADLGHSIGWGLFHNDGFGRAMIRIVRFLEQHL